MASLLVVHWVGKYTLPLVKDGVWALLCFFLCLYPFASIKQQNYSTNILSEIWCLGSAIFVHSVAMPVTGWQSPNSCCTFWP